MKKKIFSINVLGEDGYSFAVKCSKSFDENSVLNLALENGLFEDECDVHNAIVEDITDSEYDINGLKDVTHEFFL